MKACLTIAGSDPTGGAGIQMDLRTFSSLGIYGLSALTAVTVQNTQRVSALLPVPEGILRKQIEGVLSEFHIDAVKIGMLATKENVKAVADAIKAHSLTNVVLDTVLFSSGGRRLLEREALSSLIRHLFPLVTIITSNLKEAGILAALTVRDRASMKEAAVRLHRLGPRVVVVKGGHLTGPPDDLIYDGETFSFVRGTRVRGQFHGLGCAFSSAIAGFLALGYEGREAVKMAKKFLERSLKGSFAPQSGRRILMFSRPRSGYTP